jgi:tungstate transport system substrate-binding protein
MELAKSTRLAAQAGIILVALGCNQQSRAPSAITLATTTSARDSGLLDAILPMFREQSGIEVKVVAVGSGQALELGRRGDADVLLTHAAEAEQDLVDEGFARSRTPVMSNDFVVVGPDADPAGIRMAPNAAAALSQIAKTQAEWVSRGDDSGTHVKEQAIWKAAEIAPDGDWYLESGSGMAATLRMASEKGAYTLCDRGTFLALRDGLDLKILHESDPKLLNPYAVLLLSRERHPQLNHAGAEAFAEFLLAPATQRAIADFGAAQHGQPLFFPVDQGDEP